MNKKQIKFKKTLASVSECMRKEENQSELSKYIAYFLMSVYTGEIASEKIESKVNKVSKKISMSLKHCPINGR